MVYISPKEDALFTKALKWLADRTAERHGTQIEGLTVTRIKPEEKSA